MIKKLLPLSSLLFIIFYNCTPKALNTSLDSKNDSIKKYLDIANTDSIPFADRIKYNDKAYSLIDLSKNDTLTRYNLYCVSYKYYFFNKSRPLKATAEMLMTLSLKSKDSLYIGRAYRNIGLYFMLISDNERAISYFFKSKKIFKSLQKKDYILKVMGNISDTQYYASDFLGSVKTSTEIIKLSEKVNLKKINTRALISIADNLASLKNDVEAIKYYKKANLNVSSKSDIFRIYNCLSSCYINLKKYDSASKYTNLIIKDKKLLSYDPSCYSRAISLKALIQLKCNNYYKIIEKFKLADSYFIKFNSIYGRNYNQIYLSEYYEKIKDTINAIKAAQKALLLSKSYRNPSDILASLDQLIKVDNHNASKNAQEYILVNDSMQIAERRFRDKFARIAYETDKITQEKEKAINQKWLITGISLTVILIIILILIITRQRSKQKELRMHQKQQKSDQEIYHLMFTQKAKEEQVRQTEKKRIALELHDGIMNKLSSARLNLSILSHKTDEATIQRCLSYVNSIYTIEQDIRSISHDLNDDIFREEDSFIRMLEDFVIEQNKTSKTYYELEFDQEISRNSISSELKMHLYRIIQEASQNINKYSKAKNAMINLLLDCPNICLSITDDGIGFDTKAITGGIGLQNMKTRVNMLKGKITINSTKQKGTTINIATPLNNFSLSLL